MIPPMERVAVADMGSNSWRLVVEIREAVRVGAGLAQEGALRPERIERAVHTAAVFASFCRASGIEEVESVATSAIRDASNGDELLDAIRARTGLEPRVITGREEARYDWLAIANSTTIEDGFGLDMGGGSIQALRIEGRRLAEAESLRLGSVRVSEEFLPGEKAPGKAMKALRKRVATELGPLGWWGDGGRVVGVGGTIRNLAAAAMKRADMPPLDVQGFELTRDALEELIEWLADRPASKRGELPGIKPDRGDVILGGALVHAAGAGAGRADRALPPKGRSRRLRARPADAARRRGPPPAAERDHPARGAARAKPRRSDPPGERGRVQRKRRAGHRGRPRPRPERADLGSPPRGGPAGGRAGARGGDRVRQAGRRALLALIA